MTVGRKIYIASSWKNAEMVRGIALILEKEGHEVYDFTDETRHFAFNLNMLPNKEELDHISFLTQVPESREAFDTDKKGLDWSDTAIMVLPCGRSAHLELGYAVGQGKATFIFGDLPNGEYECMYHFVNGCYHVDELNQLLEVLKL